MSANINLYLIGYASGIAGAYSSSSDGPLVLQQSSYIKALQQIGLNLHWHAMLKPELENHTSKFPIIANLSHKLAINTASLVAKKDFFTVLGGDHTSAVGTWSGAYHAIKNNGLLGLIWIDAHMDSHTQQTTKSGNIHGMPLAILLGQGAPELINILDTSPKIQPEHVCLIGVRSYEIEESQLLKKLKVKVFTIEEVQQRGLAVIMQEALAIVTKGTAGFGISIDIDSLDPLEAPGTGVKEPNGIATQELCESLCSVAGHKNFIGAEIVEFDPHHDKDHMTEIIIAKLIAAMTVGKLIK